MPVTNKDKILKAIDEFIDVEPYYEGLWLGIQTMAWEYMASNIDDGFPTEINQLFVRDLIALLEMLRKAHLIT